MAAIAKFDIRALPAKGQGMVTRVGVARGELIHAEPALIDTQIGPHVLYNPKAFWNPGDKYTGLSVLRAKYDLLTAAQQLALTALHNSRAAEANTPVILGIISTNAFERHVRIDGAEHTVLYVCETLSRANRSCRPNAVVSWNPSLNRATMYATENLLANTEIVVDYMPVARDFFMTSGDRRKELQTHYGFQCSCRVCGLRANDKRDDSLLRKSTAESRAEINSFEQLQIMIDFSVHANHRPQELERLQTYISRLTTLGAKDGKFVEA
ncbi:hypothetical protein LTR15_002718 [Elasticomyces elasticus]|nr:hypothetical protein LTR15_002718 [Elasticomyces elasticus]